MPKMSYRCAPVAGRPDRGGLSVARHALDQLVAHIVVECLTDTTSAPEVSEAGGALQHAWHEVWTIPQKRAVLAALIDTLVVHPVSNAVPRFRPERVELTLRA